MDVEIWKKRKKELKLSYDDLAKMTGYSKSTITNIFCGYIEYPRHETIVEIERALGLDEDNKKTPPAELTGSEAEWLELYYTLTDENRELLVKMVTAFKDLPAERRRFVLDAIRLAQK